MSSIKIFIDGIEYDLVPKSSPAKEPERDWEVTEERKVCFEGYWTGKTEICKVKRLSDGIVFSVGDKITNYNNEVIKSFEADGKHMKVWVVSGGFYILEQITKPERTKLFTTKDGVDKYPGDNCIIVDLKTLETSGWYNLPKNLNNLSWDFNSQVKFHSQEYAKEYITLNKPTLSVNDILALWCIENPARKQLIELAKSKL